MDDQHGQRTITAGMEGSAASGTAKSWQACRHQATHCAALPGRQGRQGYAGPLSPGEVGRHGSAWPSVDGHGNAGTVGMASGGFALYRMAGKA
jgi:hypothetical protein